MMIRVRHKPPLGDHKEPQRLIDVLCSGEDAFIGSIRYATACPFLYLIFPDRIASADDKGYWWNGDDELVYVREYVDITIWSNPRRDDGTSVFHRKRRRRRS